MKSTLRFILLLCLGFMTTDGSPSTAAGAPGFARGSTSAAKARPLTIIRQGRRDGTIVRQDNGFPFVAIEDWVAAIKSQSRFDETDFRRRFPSEKFHEYKDKIKFPFDTYEEWINALKNKSERSIRLFDEAGFRKTHSGEDVARFIKDVECVRAGYVSDGMVIEGFILKPRNIAASVKLPVIIYNRGGNQDLAIIDYEKLYSLRKFIYAGYVVVASQYRGGGGSEGRDEFGGADVNDVLNLIPLIESFPYADGGRIGMFGWSRGGIMTYLSLARTKRIAAAIIAASPTDLALAFRMRPEMETVALRLIPNYANEKGQAIRARSAISWPEKLNKKTSLLLLQGSDDRNCEPSDVLKMALRLYETKHPFRLVFFEGGTHGLNEHEKEVDSLILDWFNRYLRETGK